MGRGRLAGLLYLAAAGAYALDRVTKLWAERRLAGGEVIRVIPGALHLDYTTNSGGAFGIGQAAPWLFAGATAVVAVAIVLASLRLGQPLTAAALGLVLGGALGNLTDRVARGPGLSGRVVDFVDLRVWPVFNLADAAIVVGALLLVLSGTRRGRGRASSAEGAPRAPHRR